MKKTSNLATVLLLIVILAACGQQTPTPEPTPVVQPTVEATTSPPETATSHVEFAQAFVDLLVAGEYEQATQDFDETMLEALPADQLGQIWLRVNTQAGLFQRQVGVRSESQPPYEIIYVTCEFEQELIDVRVVLDEAGQISGLFFAPSESPDESSQFEPPAYADLDAIEESEVEIGSGDWILPGTLTLPLGDGPFPAVVLVHGSGPNDRDETIGPNKPFRDLAWGLASQGIAVLRYEKRTRHYANEMAALEQEITVNQETVEDALAAVALLRTTPAVDPDRIFVLGHSLGAMLAPRIGSQDDAIAGLVLLAGNSRPLEDVILDQIQYIANLDNTLSETEQQQITELEEQIALAKSTDLDPDTPATDLPLGIPAPYWLDLRSYDQVAVAETLSQPMLILQGERDYQVTLDDLAGWRRGLAERGEVTFKLYPDLNHLFIAGEGQITPGEYEIAGHVDQAVIEDIADWVLQ